MAAIDPTRSFRSLWCRVCLTFVLILAVPLQGSAQGVLQAMRTDVRVPDASPAAEDGQPDPAPDKSKKKSRRKWSDADDDEDHSWPAELLAVAALAAGCAVTTPIWGPRYLLDDTGELGFYPRFPYEEELPGYVMIDPEVPITAFPWSTRLRGEYGDSFDDVSYVNGHLLFETTSRFGADADANYRWETAAAGSHDSLWTGDTNLLYRFAQSEHWQFRAGAGASWIADSAGVDWGYNLTYSCDWFPRRPWILSAEMDWGEVGHAHLVHLRATIGCQFHGVEFYTGYDYFDLGRRPLSGMVGGLQFWF
jgi:hypothetical protein